MKKILTTLTLLTSIPCLSSQGEEPSKNLAPTLQKNPNYIYLGPEVFWLDLNTHFNGVKVRGSKFFLGLKLGYEYIKPDAFYFGIDFLAAGANKGFHESLKGQSFPQSSEFAGFGNFELRFGYTFSTTQWLATPFLCIGGYSLGSGSHHHHFDEKMSYLGAGVRSRYEFSQTFNLGVNAKVFSAIYRDERWRFVGLKRVNHDGLWGGEIGIPLTWRVGTKKKWDIQLEPYFLKLDFAEVQNIYGTRILFGYRF